MQNIYKMSFTDDLMSVVNVIARECCFQVWISITINHCRFKGLRLHAPTYL